VIREFRSFGNEILQTEATSEQTSIGILGYTPSSSGPLLSEMANACPADSRNERKVDKPVLGIPEEPNDQQREESDIEQ